MHKKTGGFEPTRYKNTPPSPITGRVRAILKFFFMNINSNYNSCPSRNGLFAQALRYAQKIIHPRRINPRNIKYMPVVIFFACLPSSL